jgi:hypothetical protein
MHYRLVLSQTTGASGFVSSRKYHVIASYEIYNHTSRFQIVRSDPAFDRFVVWPLRASERERERELCKSSNALVLCCRPTFASSCAKSSWCESDSWAPAGNLVTRLQRRDGFDGTDHDRVDSFRVGSYVGSIEFGKRATRLGSLQLRVAASNASRKSVCSIRVPIK